MSQDLSTIRWMQGGFLGVFILCAWAPFDRQTWLMENGLILIGAVAVWRARQRFYWSPRSWAQVLLFCCLHEVGTHFTYPRVPYDAGLAQLTGIRLNDLLQWERNQYDRFVHLAFGVLMALPCREILVRQCALQGAWASLLAWSLVLATSLLYELMEWVGGDLFGAGSSFIGAQGDVWDAQKDMALATVGALVVLMLRGHRVRDALTAPVKPSNT